MRFNADGDRRKMAATARVWAACLVLASLMFSAAQGQQLVQVKTFNEDLKPYPGLEISINNDAFFAMNGKGVAFVEFTDAHLPIKTIRVRNEELEAASWNYAKGTLEIIVRKKSYKVVPVFVFDHLGEPLKDTPMTFRGTKEVNLRTDADGKVELLFAVNDHITGADQFRIKGYRILRLELGGERNALFVERIAEPPVTALAQEPKPEIASEYFKDFDLSKIDSIQSLTAFYAIFKNYSVSDLNTDVKKKLDEKLNELVGELQDSIRRSREAFVGSISDSSFVIDDIRNLIGQAEVESSILIDQRREFDEKFQIINEKIEAAGDNMDEATRTILLSDLTRLERLLTENESRFYKNQNDYRSILNSLKERFFHIDVLENKLSQSEAQRLEERRIFRERLLMTIGIASLFALMALLLVYFALKLRKRKRELEVAHLEVKRINENLEGLVQERTKMLIDTNRELDLFLYKASHDLRSPVTSIIGLCNIAAHLNNGNDTKELFEKAGQTALAMDKLLRKLRIISEVNQPGHFTSIDLLPLMENLRDRFQGFIAGKNIQVEILCPPDLSFYSNATLTEAILQALFENALFYSTLGDTTPKVGFSATLAGDHLEVSVRDNGIGIGDDIRSNIFDMFFIGNERSKGNGLGLYIVDKAVQALKGNIVLDTMPGSYTRFVITIPIRSALRTVEPGEVDRSLPERRVFAEAQPQ